MAEYAYLSDGTRLCAQRGDGSGVQYRGSLIYSKSTDGTLTLDCALTTGGAIVKQDGGESASGGTYQVRHYLRDHLGSVRTVVDGATGDIPETNDFLPFGKRWDLTGGSSTQTLTDPGNRWRFSGKEDQSFFNPAIPYYDFGARLHDPRTARWLCPDPLAEKYYPLSLYCFCSNNPISIHDNDGMKIVDKQGQEIKHDEESGFSSNTPLQLQIVLTLLMRYPTGKKAVRAMLDTTDVTYSIEFTSELLKNTDNGLYDYSTRGRNTCHTKEVNKKKIVYESNIVISNTAIENRNEDLDISDLEYAGSILLHEFAHSLSENINISNVKEREDHANIIARNPFLEELRNNKLPKVNEKALTNKRLLSIDTADPVLRHLPRPRSPIL